MKSKIAGATVVLLAVASTCLASPITGNVTLTSGIAWMDSNGAGFSLVGPNFSASTMVDFEYRPGDTFLPTATDNFSCNSGSGTFQGVAAACFGPFENPATGGPAAYTTPEGINFSFGSTTMLSNGDQVGYFTATGELIGFTPQGCAGGVTITCTELWDVTFNGRGEFTFFPNASGSYIQSVEADFNPDDPLDAPYPGLPSPTATPEPETACLVLLGLSFVAGSRFVHPRRVN